MRLIDWLFTIFSGITILCSGLCCNPFNNQACIIIIIIIYFVDETLVEQVKKQGSYRPKKPKMALLGKNKKK
jgi:hypothetical protein